MNRRERRHLIAELRKKAKELKKKAGRIDREIAHIVSGIQSGQQVIGSIEVLPAIPKEEDLPEVPQGIKIVIIPSVDTNTLVVYKEGNEHILNLYKRYELEPTMDILTRDEHEALGKAFGFSDSEVEWFLEEYDEEMAAHSEPLE